jgi:hypothetical protein
MTTQAKILAYLTAACLCFAAGFYEPERPCVTDSECTDADVFGDECPPNDCEETL